jgi:hypothetical protein
MSNPISATANQAIREPETKQIFLVLLKISHTDLPSTLYFVNNNENVVSNGDIYEATAFRFTLPYKEGNTIAPAQLIIDNVDRRVVEAVRSITTPADIEASIVLASDPDTYEYGPLELSLTNVSYNASTVSGDLLYVNFLGFNAGVHIMDNIKFPGLAEWI